jgi:hypothetical protein
MNFNFFTQGSGLKVQDLAFTPNAIVNQYSKILRANPKSRRKNTESGAYFYAILGRCYLPDAGRYVYPNGGFISGDSADTPAAQRATCARQTANKLCGIEFWSFYSFIQIALFISFSCFPALPVY